MDWMSSGQGSAHGLTLIELMIVLLILGITLAFGGPAMRQLIYGMQVSSEISRLMGSVNLVRSEALRLNQAVTMCPSSMARTGNAICGGDFADGWIIFSNRDRDKVVDAEDRLIRVFEALPAGFTVTNRKGTIPASERITYLSDGSSRRNRTLLVCAPDRGASTARSLVMNIVGRPRLAREWGTCPAV